MTFPLFPAGESPLELSMLWEREEQKPSLLSFFWDAEPPRTGEGKKVVPKEPQSRLGLSFKCCIYAGSGILEI